MTSKKVPAAVLKDVVAYVDVWSASKTENYSDPFIQQLRDMGAQVCKTFNKQVTHVVFKHGHQATWNKAKKMGVKLVSVHWVARCKENGEHADEDLYPAHNEESQLSHLKKRTHRCMQPRDIPLSTPQRLKRKLDKMMEELVRSSPVVTDTDTSPFIIDEENGIVYSPSSRRADTMAQRLREMRAQRENLSPTASQIQGSPTDDSIRPSLGDTPTDLNKLLLEEEEEASNCLSLTSSSSETGLKERHKKISSKKTANRHVEKSPPDLDVGVRFSSSGVKEVVPSPQNKRRSKSCSRVKKQKQSSLDYVHTVSSKKSDSPLLSEPKAGATEKPRQSLGNKKRSQIRSSLSSMETGPSQLPESTKEIKTNSDSGDCDRTHLLKLACSPKSNDLKIQKALNKKKPADMSGSGDQFDPHNDNNNDDSVFEDYFTSANDAPKRKVLVLHSASEAERLPSFDLQPLNRARRKSHSRENCSRNRKSKILNDRAIMEASGPPEEELLAACMGASLPVPKESEFEKPEQEPASKKQRRTTKQNSVTLSESTHSKSTSDGLTDRCTELCSEMNKKRIVKMDKYMKNRTLVMTSMPTEKQQTVIQVVNSLGGFTVVDTVCESTTHVVSGSPRRTLNILLGIARGCWILSFEWILWCLEHRQWVPEEPYELSDHFPAAPICRLQQHLSAGEHQQDLFRDQPLMFVSSLSQPPCHSLTELVQLCGGAVCRSVRQASICIGEYKGKKPEGTKCLSEQWILDCVTHHVLLPYDNYLLE
ncbi:microcephalin isoform X2 [Pangasianodon hypophthalmus]|uniref:microcephalin isoform X2 n=1 Tax=Pangasianodon hypophthalmus TaxID=310915 RepID=UPI000EFF99FA|nr:microcephalin isoform X2 [Pangasianodon hypophthalmus]